MDKSLEKAALYWYDFGLAVVPIRPKTKITAISWEFSENLSREIVKQYWRKKPFYEVGFIVGDEFMVLDADTPEAVKTLDIVEASHDIKPTLVVKTTRGEHRYFRLAPGTFTKSTGHGQGPEQKIDIKTGRTMVVLPPSDGKKIILQTAKSTSELTEVNQCFVDSVYLMIGKPAPRPPKLTAERPIIEPNTKNLADIIKLLQALSPDIGYTQWTKVGMAIFFTTGGSDDGLELYDAWSSKGKKYRGRREIECKWRSFSLDVPKPVTIGSLIYIAKGEGIDVSDILQERFEPCKTVVISGGAK